MIATTKTPNYFATVSQMPGDHVEAFHNVTWDEYEELVEQVGKARGLRISYNDGTLNVKPLSFEREKYADILTEYLAHMRKEGEFEAINAFDEWLQSLPQ